MRVFEDDCKLPTECEASTSDLQQSLVDKIVNAVTAQLQDSYDIEITSFKDPLVQTVHTIGVRVRLENGKTRSLVYHIGAFDLFGFGENTRDFVVENHVRRIVSTVHRVVHALKQRP